MQLILLIMMLVSTIVYSQGYENLSLQDCIEIAKKNSLMLASTKLNEKTASSSLTQAKNARLPGLSGSASQDIVGGRPLGEPSTFEYVEGLGLNLNSSMPLYTGGRIKHNINHSEHRREMASLNSEAAERNLSEQVIRAYMQLLSVTESEGSARASHALSKRLLARDSVLFNAGSFTATDLALAYAQAASDSLSVLQAQSNQSQNLTTLRQLLEIPHNSAFSIAPPDSFASEATESYDVLLRQAKQNSINQRIDSLAILAADEAIGVANSGRYPNINLSGRLGTGLAWKTANYAEQLKNFSYSLGLGLSISIVDWGATQHSILVAQVAKEQAQISALNTQKSLENSIEQLVLQVETYRLQWDVSTIQLDAQRLALEKSVQQHELGLLDVSALVQQQTIYNNSQVRHNQAKYNYLLGKSLLDLHTGN